MSARLTALDFVAGCLAVDGSSQRNDALRSVMASGQADWPVVLRIANGQLVSPALWVELRKRGLMDELPGDVRDYLSEMHRMNRVRNERLRSQALEAVGAFNAIGVVPVLLKGTASLFSGVYDDPGSRVMLDLDILVPREKAEACWNQLHTLGYVPIDCGRDFSRHHHLEPLERPGEYATIEIHRDALPKRGIDFLPTERIWAQSALADHGGAIMRVSDPTSQIELNILHAAVAHGAYETASGSLRSLHELALAVNQYPDRINWTKLRGDFRRNGKPRILDAWIYLSHRMFGCPRPKGIGDTPSSAAYYARYRLQARWSWVDELVKRVCLFSAHSISERYECDDRFLSLNAGRLHLILEVASDYGRRIARRGRRSHSDTYA